MNTYHAVALADSSKNFDFSTWEEFETKKEELEELEPPVVSFDIQWKDGDSDIEFVFYSAKIDQDNLEDWFEYLEDEIDTFEDARAMDYLLDDIGLGIEDTAEKYEDVRIFEGRLADYAQELTEGCTEIPENLKNYIDYESMANDMDAGGEVTEIGQDLYVTNPNDF